MKTLRVVCTRAETAFDFKIDDANFDFKACVQSIKDCAGLTVNSNLFIPLSSIACVTYGDDATLSMTERAIRGTMQ